MFLGKRPAITRNGSPYFKIFVIQELGFYAKQWTFDVFDIQDLANIQSENLVEVQVLRLIFFACCTVFPPFYTVFGMKEKTA